MAAYVRYTMHYILRVPLIEQDYISIFHKCVNEYCLNLLFADQEGPYLSNPCDYGDLCPYVHTAL